MKLHPITGRNRYCGPGAISTITGLNSDHAARAIRRLSGQRAVKAAPWWALQKALQEFGYDLTAPDTSMKGETFKHWLDHTMLRSDRVYLVFLTRHFVVVQGDQFNDNHTKVPVHVSIAPHQRRKVNSVCEVTAQMGVEVAVQQFVDKRRIDANARVNHNRKMKRKLDDVCKKHSMRIEKAGGLLMVKRSSQTILFDYFKAVELERFETIGEAIERLLDKLAEDEIW